MACPACFTGYTRTDTTPTGTISTIYGLPTYIAHPPSSTTRPKGIIIFIPDAFGWTFINSRLLADTYAASGFRVYLPDFMAGVPAPLYLMSNRDRLTHAQSWYDTLLKPYDLFWTVVGIVPFLWWNWPSASFPRVATFLEKLRTKPMEGDEGLKIGAAGFCWGGKHVFTLARQENKHLVDGLFTAHPSFLNVPGDAEGCRKGVSVAVGDGDDLLSLEKVREMEGVFRRLEKEGELGEGGRAEVVVYEGAAHGFGVRIDMKNEKQVEQSVQAERQAVRWFEETLK